jgi:hypothetical protein
MARRLAMPGLHADALAGLPATLEGVAPLALPTVCTVTLDALLTDACSGPLRSGSVSAM